MREVKFSRFISGQVPVNEESKVDKFPESCPICHYSIEPQKLLGSKNVSANGIIKDNLNVLELVLKCPRSDCESIFISYYNKVGAYYHYLKSFPIINNEKTFSSELMEISPEFSRIYNQAAYAERVGLDHIAGMGFRKALEFLVKDYLINFIKLSKEEIEHRFLGKCIKENIENSNIKLVAERAAWLGNDETHYVRKWVEKDISDLKILIDLTVYWIDSEILTKKVIDEM